jgi:hypothetical protein
MVDRFRMGNLGEIVMRKDSVFTIFMRFFPASASAGASMADSDIRENMENLVQASGNSDAVAAGIPRATSSGPANRNGACSHPPDAVVASAWTCQRRPGPHSCPMSRRATYVQWRRSAPRPLNREG